MLHSFLSYTTPTEQAQAWFYKITIKIYTTYLAPVQAYM